MGCLPFSSTPRNSGLTEVKWNSNFPENPFGNDRLTTSTDGPLFEVSLPCVTFSVSSLSLAEKQLRKIELKMVCAISFCLLCEFWKTLSMIQRSSQRVHSDKW